MTLTLNSSPYIVGCAKLGSPVPSPWHPGDAANFRYLDQVLELGLKSFDLAAAYQIGGTEALFGRWLRSSRCRDRVFLITKGGHPIPGLVPHRLKRSCLEQDLHASLKRLQTDSVQLYLLHRDDHHTPLEELVQTFDSFFRSGKIQAWGLSNWETERIAELSALAERQGLPKLAASSPQFSVFGWREPPWNGCVSISQDALAHKYYSQSQLPCLAWSPFGGGSLTKARVTPGAYQLPENQAKLSQLQALAERLRLSVSSLILAYLKAQNFPVFPIIGACRLEQMRENLQACELKLSQLELTELMELAAPKELTELSSLSTSRNSGSPS